MKKVLSLLLILLIFCGSGCHSVRKKFVRKKQIEKDAPVYVDFKDYAKEPSRDNYINYYLFVKSWLDDLVEALKKQSSYKRQKQAVNETILNFEQIVSFYNQEGKEKVSSLHQELLEMKAEVEKSPNMSEMKKYALIREISLFKREFERKLNYTDAKEWID